MGEDTDRGHYITDPNNAFWRANPTFALFDTPKMGNLMTPDM